jgi:hypothetical protein
VDGIAFPHAATVHSDDAATLIDNVPVLRDITDTARSLIQGPALALAPLALYYPSASGSRAVPMTLIGPWLAATILQAAAAGLDAVTLDNELAQACDDERAQDSAAMLLDVLLQSEGSTVTLFVDQERPRLHLAELIRRDNRPMLLAVNLDETALNVRIDRWAPCLAPAALAHFRSLTRHGELSLPPWSIRWLA